MTHIGRSWDGGGHIEALCPCPLMPCGLVDRDNLSDECTQHPPQHCKTMRTGHAAEDCLGVGRALVLAVGKTDTTRRAILDAACLEPVGFFNMSLFDAIDDYRAAVEHEAAERIRVRNHAHYEVAGPLYATEAADHIDPEVTS